MPRQCWHHIQKRFLSFQYSPVRCRQIPGHPSYGPRRSRIENGAYEVSSFPTPIDAHHPIFAPTPGRPGAGFLGCPTIPAAIATPYRSGPTIRSAAAGSTFTAGRSRCTKSWQWLCQLGGSVFVSPRPPSPRGRRRRKPRGDQIHSPAPAKGVDAGHWVAHTMTANS